MVKILTVDDSIFERNVIKNILKNSGYSDIIEANHGDDGLRICRLEKPDLVLLDLRMPGMSGMDVLGEIREICPDVKVIVLSIIRNKETIEDCLKSGALAYISKPVTEDKLIPEVERVLNSM